MKKTKLVLVIGAAVVILIGAVSVVNVEKNNESSHITSAQAGVGQNVTTNKPGQVEGTSPSKQNQTPTPIVLNSQPSLDFKPGIKFAPEGLDLADNTFVFDSRRADVNGDNILDDVILCGEKQGDNNPYVQNISVVLKDGQTGKFSRDLLGDLNVGLEPKLFIGSFTKAGSNDILVSLATGGSGGVYQYGLLAAQDGKLASIVTQNELNRGLVLDTKCLTGFNLKVTDKNSGYTTTIDLHKGSADYERLGIYNEKGELLKDPMVLIDGFSVLKPELNGDGIYELHGIQRISVGTHANTVANAESVWIVNNGNLKLLSEKIEALN